MRQFIISMVLLIALLVKEKFARAQASPPFTLTEIPAQRVPVTFNKMTNLVFPVGIRTGIKVSREILVQKVKGLENVIELKAARPHVAATNLSVFGLDGRLYSFELEYVDSPLVLSFMVISQSDGENVASFVLPAPIQLSGLPVNESVLAADAVELSGRKAFLHGSARNEKMGLRLRGIYCKDSLLWLVLGLSNQSLISYRPEYLRLSIVDRTRAKRTAIQRVPVEPIYEKLPSSVEGRTVFAVGIPLLTIASEKKLVLELAEKGGGRVLELPVNSKQLLKARREVAEP
jgi:conjugative transposon TraN protein